MSSLVSPDQCFYFLSIIFNQNFWDEKKVLEVVKARFAIDDLFYPRESPSLAYYSKEMGEKERLSRLICISFKKSSREDFVSHKLWATKLELIHSHEGARSINIDVGLLAKEQMLLATGKPYAHRVYLSDGVYADLNYIFSQKKYQTLPWTYPDYGCEEKILFFEKARKFLLA